MKENGMRALVCCVGFAIGSLPAMAVAQGVRDFSALHVSVGDKVYVTDAATGVEVSGPLTALTASELNINGHVFTPIPGLTIEKAGDSIWDGTLLASGIGVLSGVTIGSEACLHRSLWPCAVSGAVSWGLIGALIDSVHRGRTTIYRGSSAVRPGSARWLPQFERGRKGVSLAFAF
jgi:hypothetical protein